MTTFTIQRAIAARRERKRLERAWVLAWRLWYAQSIVDGVAHKPPKRP